MARIECPECGNPADDQDFACSHCELILNPEASVSGARSHFSIVRALISQPDFSSTRDDIPKPPALPNSVHEQVTVLRQVSLSGDEIPRLLADIDVALHPLHPFEAYVVSFFDGVTSAREVSLAAELRMVEVNAVLSSLMERKLVVLDPPRKPAARPAAPPPRDFDEDEETFEAGPDDAMPTEPLGYAAVSVTPPAPPPAKPALPPSLPAAKAVPSSPRVPALDPSRRPAPTPARPAPPPRMEPPAEARPAPSPPGPSPSGKTPAIPRPAVPPPAQRSEPPRATVHPKQDSGTASRVTRQQPPARRPGMRVVPLEEAKIQDPVKNCLERAVALERRGEMRGAIEVLKLGIARASKPAPLYNKLALILLDQRRDFAQAEELLNKALAAEPQNTVYQQNLYRVVSAAAAETGNQPAVKVDPKSKLFSKLFNK